MARLRYNRLVGYLAADITSGALSLTLVDPLQEGGVNIPTVAAPDVLPITIDDEVIYITAYTSGSTTATITRGEEDTVPAAHTTGTRIFNGPTKMDIGGGAGAVAVTIAAFDSSDEFKARADYVCDGINDEVQFAAAIADTAGNYATTGSTLTIFLSPGNFVIDSSIVVDLTRSRNVRIVGSGAAWHFYASSSSYIYRNSAGNYPLLAAGSGTGGLDIEFEHVSIADDDIVLNSAPLIECFGTGNTWIFRSCYINNWNSNASPVIEIVGTGTRLLMENCDIEATGTCIYHDPANTVAGARVFVRDCGIYSAAAADFAINLSTLGGDWQIHFADLDAWWNDGGAIRIDGSVSNTPLPRVEIRDCRLDNHTLEAVYISDCAYLRIEDCYIGSDEHSVRLSNIDRGFIAGNDISDSSGKHGIWVLDCDNLVIRDNFIRDAGAATSDTYSGIILDGDTNDCLVEGNKITVSTTAINPLYGIRIDDSTCDNNTVINNDLRLASNTAGNEFSDAGTGTVAGLEATTLSGWWQDNVAASQTGVVLALSNGRTEIPMPAAGHVVGVAVYSNAARSAGTLTVEPTINGTGVGLTAILDGTNTQTKTTRQGHSADAFTAGQRIGVKITTDGTWAPTTADIDVSVLVVYDTANRT